MEVGSRVRICVGSRCVIGRVTAIYNAGMMGQFGYIPEHHGTNVYWDLAYEIENPAPGRGSHGRWKQNADGGRVEVLADVG